MKKCSISQIIREMQIKTTIRYQLSKNGYYQKDKKKHGSKDAEKGKLIHSW
jgi:hypothetical protein